MGPNSNESLQLPAPMPEQGPVTGGSNEALPQKAEKAPSPEAAQQAGAAPPPSLPTIPLPTPPAMPAPLQSAGPVSSKGNPAQAADDRDLIEKEWVTKAKQIVEQTHDDPFKQSEELNVFKADYMKKRYNRTIKVSK
ncbi:MAG TPA: hypothetical protein VLG27_02750 [Candidatus Saccharimonadia bacterium]|nr:hypothetical protein [Candidatus Saccharimonadia bacterium]